MAQPTTEGCMSPALCRLGVKSPVGLRLGHVPKTYDRVGSLAKENRRGGHEQTQMGHQV
jgi:hypothetical protein